MIDRSGQGSGEPAVAAFPIAPNDANYLPFVPRAVYIGGAGNIAVMMYTGDVVIFTSVAPGSVLPIRIVKVFFTGTTATGLVGMY